MFARSICKNELNDWEIAASKWNRGMTKPISIGMADQLKTIYAQLGAGKISWEKAAELESLIHASPIRSSKDPKTTRRELQTKWRAYACRLPFDIRAHFSDAQASALEALVFLTGHTAEIQIHVATIARLASCSVRTVQYMLKVATTKGFLKRREIRRTSKMNAPSIFTILDLKLKKLAHIISEQHVERMDELGAKNCGQINIRISKPTSDCNHHNQTCREESQKDPANRSDLEKPLESAARSRHQDADAIKGALQISEGGISAATKINVENIGQAALRKLRTDPKMRKALEHRTTIARIPADADWREIAQTIRREAFPSIHQNYWESRTRIHGDLALLGIFEVWIKTHSHTEKPIRNPGQYLIGILRKPRRTCRPDLSLSKIISVTERICA